MAFEFLPTLKVKGGTSFNQSPSQDKTAKKKIKSTGKKKGTVKKVKKQNAFSRGDVIAKEILKKRAKHMKETGRKTPCLEFLFKEITGQSDD